MVKDPIANKFSIWASLSSKTELPNDMQFNCWEMILLSSYKANELSWEKIHEIYGSAFSNTFAGRFMRELGFSLTKLKRQNNATSLPAGSIVFFTKPGFYMNHVAIATGNSVMFGKKETPEIYTFWPPNRGEALPGDVLEIHKSSIEEIQQYYVKISNGNTTSLQYILYHEPEWK